MEDQASKIKHGLNIIKGFMALVVIMQVVQIYQTSVIDFSSIAGTVGVLSIFKGFLSSPSVLATPIKYWFKPNFAFSKESYKYFFLAFILIVVSTLSKYV
jgi:hypothetical protein